MKLCDLTVSRMIAAAPEAVFDVWMDAESPGGPWFGSQRLILTPAVDGLFYQAVGHQGRTFAHYGRFLHIERPLRVEHTWVSEGTRGLESIVAVAFERRGSQTEVTLRHSGVPDDEEGRKQEQGWAWALSTLAKKLEG
jgi:uncharacterized protein YndB with AHSA1/START domain